MFWRLWEILKHIADSALKNEGVAPSNRPTMAGAIVRSLSTWIVVSTAASIPSANPKATSWIFGRPAGEWDFRTRHAIW